MSLLLITTVLPVVAGHLQHHAGWLAGGYVLLSSPLLDFILSLNNRNLETQIPNDLALEPHSSGVQKVFFHFYAVTYIIFFLRFIFSSPDLSNQLLVFNALSWILMGGIPGLIVGHALIHSRSKIDRRVGQFLFICVNYPHFPMAHVQVHHRHVATAKDFQSAKKGQGFYTFLFSGLVHEATYMVTKVLDRATSSKSRLILLASEALRCFLVFVIYAIGGYKMTLVYLISTFFIRSIVWLVNYVQHYGLNRNNSDSPSLGREVDHSWDIQHRSTNLLFFNAGLHGDHHERPSTAPLCLKLKSRKIFPYNFPMILIAALIPQHFFDKMNPLLEDDETNTYH